MGQLALLSRPPSDGALRLDPLTPDHREPLRAACAEDREIWAIYPTNWSGAAFDGSFDALLGNAARMPFAIVADGALAGITAYLGHDPARGVVEIGNSFLRPAARGSGLNGRVKRRLLDHAFACGIRRVEFRVDTRNARSQAAVAKLGAVKEGVLRAERITWTGHVRDTALFSILRDEWAAARAADPADQLSI